VNLMIDAANAEEKAKAEGVKRQIFELASRWVEPSREKHGIGIMKSEFLPMALDPDLIAR